MERPAFLAGRWYPKDERGCRAAIERHALKTTPESGSWRGLIGPHAGWTYSGDAAGHAYRWLAESQPDPDLVVVFGSHRGPRSPNTVFRAQGWRTPLGSLETDATLANALSTQLNLADEPVNPRKPDNAVELHLPFVKHFFPRAKMLMLGVAAADVATDIGKSVGDLVREKGIDAVFVGSTDLTHYGPNYRFSPKGGGSEAVRWVREENDQGFLNAILADDPHGALRHAASSNSACCSGAVVATMEAIRAYSGAIQPQLIDHYLSCDIRPSASFVGYAGLVL